MRPRQIYGFGNAEQRSQREREREKLKQKPNISETYQDNSKRGQVKTII